MIAKITCHSLNNLTIECIQECIINVNIHASLHFFNIIYILYIYTYVYVTVQMFTLVCSWTYRGWYVYYRFSAKKLYTNRFLPGISRLTVRQVFKMGNTVETSWQHYYNVCKYNIYNRRQKWRMSQSFENPLTYIIIVRL